MKRLATLCLVFAACGTTEQQDTPRVGVVRQAGLPRVPIRSGGVDGGHLGFSVAACRVNSVLAANQAFAAGAPGVPAAYLFAPQTLTAQFDGGPGVELGNDVLCQGSGVDPELLAHGNSGSLIRVTSGATQLLLSGLDVGAMTRGDATNNSPSLLNVSNDVFRMTNGAAAMWLSEPGTGHRMACALGSDLCVIANRNGGAKIYDVGSGSTNPVSVIDQGDGGMHDITAVAIGELHPAQGLEVAIADQSRVEVYATGSRPRLLYTLKPLAQFQTRFGNSLAVDRFDAGGGLSSLWVGSPNEGLVYRFFGDAGGAFGEPAAPGPALFGWAMATEGNGQLLITAPKFTNIMMVPAPEEAGAVFRDTPEQWLPLGFIAGAQQECDIGLPCRVATSGTACQVGVCIGGVICGSLGSIGPCGDGGVDSGVDAGRDGGNTSTDGGMVIDDGGVVFPTDGGRDAGQPDAGRDAGSDVIPILDAGPQTDAGQSADAGTLGVQQFATCGCSSPALTPLLFIVLALARRRVGAGGRVQ
ncbi:MAG: hypothetical protein QM817_37625 [Archangium sp.]